MVNGLLIAGLCLIWGATWVAIKIGLSDSPPLFGAGFRFLLATLVLGVIVWRWRRPWPRRNGPWGWIGLAGILMYFGSYATVYYVEQYINAALAAILFASFPFFVAIGAHFHLPGERLTLLRVTGLLVGFIGVVIVFSGGAAAPGTTRWWAPLLMLFSPFISAVASIIIKRHLVSEDPVVVNFVQMAVGAAVLLPFAALMEDLNTFVWSTASVGAVVFLALFGSVFTFVTYYHLLRTMEATKLALIAFVTPIVASILGWIVLGEELTIETILGAILVLAGIWIVNVMAVRRRTARTHIPS